MSRLTCVPWAVLVALSCVQPGRADSLPDRQALQGLDSIAVKASAGAARPARCGSTASLVHAAVADRVGQAGLNTAEGAPLVANIQAATLLLDRDQICVSSITLRIGLFAFYYTDPAVKKERLGEVALVNKSGMLTSDPASHPQQITILVHRMLDEFLLDWRDANPAAQMGSLAPAAGGEPAAVGDSARIAGAQKRLVDLGLYRGAIDGVIGRNTARAIARFQNAYGLEVTGELDEATYAALARQPLKTRP